MKNKKSKKSVTQFLIKEWDSSGSLIYVGIIDGWTLTVRDMTYVQTQLLFQGNDEDMSRNTDI